MHRVWALLAVMTATSALGAECVYVAPNGFEASFEPGYLVIDQGSDDRWCQTEAGPTGGFAECPTDQGGIKELEYSIDGATMTFDGLVWERRCFTPA